MALVKIYYRLSDRGYAKVKPAYINNTSCLRNFVAAFGAEGLEILADNVSDETLAAVLGIAGPGVPIVRASIGSSAQTFAYVFEKALVLPPELVVYFVENDYVHRPGSRGVLLEGLSAGADYVTLYDHPDKYLPREQHGNPFVERGGEPTRVLLSPSCHWKVTNSTTMTFATRVSTLRADADLIRPFIQGTYPRDFQMFLALAERGRTLVSPLPAYATHGETAWLAPLVDWEAVLRQTLGQP